MQRCGGNSAGRHLWTKDCMRHQRWPRWGDEGVVGGRGGGAGGDGATLRFKRFKRDPSPHMSAGVDFSELYKQSNGLCMWSPDGNLLAVAVNHRLVVRDVETLQVRAFPCRPRLCVTSCPVAADSAPFHVQ